jgi:UDP-N-acetylmuramate dehydrogenase
LQGLFVSSIVNLNIKDKKDLWSWFHREHSLSPSCEVLGRNLTTIAVGGPLGAYCEIDSVSKLSYVVKYLTSKGLPWRVIGNGSNVLLPDRELDCFVLKLVGQFKEHKISSEGKLDVGAATSLMLISRKISQLAFSGLEFASGIPATFGGALRMNAGAHGFEIGQLVEYIDCMSALGELIRVPASELDWSYRNLSFKTDLALGKNLVIVGARLKLCSGDSKTIEALRREFLEYRKLTQPLTYPSFGSVFKNPSGHKAGALIERCSLKGAKVGGAAISEQHANWIVNLKKQATARDVYSLITIVKSKVAEQSLLELQTEVDVWGESSL